MKDSKERLCIYDRQHDANFQGNPLLQATKRHLNNSETVKILFVVFSACKKIYFLFILFLFYLAGRPAVRPNRNYHVVTGIAHLVERPAEKPDAVLSRVRIPGAASFFVFFLPESAFSADSLMVSVQFPCVITCINVCAYVTSVRTLQIPNSGSRTTVWTQENAATEH